jgi:hypothetical protein
MCDLSSYSREVVHLNPVKADAGVRWLRATLPLLGDLQPLVRQEFVPPLAFLVPAARDYL